MGSPQDLIAERYRLQRRIAAGGMGVVWEARDELLQRPVAVKQLRTQAGATEDEAELAKQRAMREARITARLHHPNAVPVFDTVEHDGEPCLVMQYVPSEPLSALLRRRGPLPVGETARIGAEVAAALAAAHALGIVHRDVKPGNVLIADDDGTALISDFGISHALGDATLTSTGFMHGTPAYLAPEVARGDESTFASDVFSLGSTLYAASEGRAPFGEEPNSIAVLHRVASGGFQAPTGSGALGPLLLRMMGSDPDARPTMREAARRLATIAAADDAPVPTLPLVSDAAGTEPTAFDEGDEPTAWVPVQSGEPATLVVEAAAPDGATAGAELEERGDEKPVPEPEPEPEMELEPEPEPEMEPEPDPALVPAAAAQTAQTARTPTAITPTMPTPTATAPTGTAVAAAPVAPPPAPPPLAAEPAPNRRRRRGLLIGVPVLVLLLLLGGLALLRGLLPSGTPDPQTSRPAAAASRPSATPTTSPSPVTSSASPSPTSTPSSTPTARSTPSAPATSAAPPASGGTSTASPVAAISRYYSLMPGDTADAWPLMTADYQQNHAGGRAAYDAFWAKVRSVSASRIRSIGTNRVEATIVFHRTDGSVETDDTTFGLVEEGGVLKIASSAVVGSG